MEDNYSTAYDFIAYNKSVEVINSHKHLTLVRVNKPKEGVNETTILSEKDLPQDKVLSISELFSKLDTLPNGIYLLTIIPKDNCYLTIDLHSEDETTLISNIDSPNKYNHFKFWEDDFYLCGETSAILYFISPTTLNLICKSKEDTNYEFTNN